MIFLVIIFFVTAVVGTLVYIDNANVKKIEDFLMHQNCQTVHYTKGTYQGICADKVVVIDNAFKVDLGEAKMVYYKTLKEIQNNKKSLLLKSNEDVTLKFKDETSKEEFLKKLEEKRNQ